MKLLVAALLVALPCLAQIPAHAVNGSVTVDVTDISVPVLYGPAEIKASVSICVAQDATYLNAVFTTNLGASIAQLLQLQVTPKGNCATAIIAAKSADISTLDVLYTNAVTFTTPPVTK